MRDEIASTARAIAGATLLAICVFGWLGFESQRGFLCGDAEFYTAERSREMLLLGPSAVHDNFELTGVKPPLQYWLSALTLPRFEKAELALRIWPLLYGLLATATLGWLALVMDRKHPALITLSVFLLLSCQLFLRTAFLAKLDAGLIFYTTLVIVSAQLARNRPGWWLVTALACWLGALQKNPLILMVWIVIVALRLRDPEQRQTLKSWWLFLAFVAALLAVTIWPLLQMREFHLSPAEVFRYRELSVIASRRADLSYFAILYRLTTTWLCGGFALAAAILLPFLKTNRERIMVTELSFLCLTLVGLSLLSNTRDINYLGPILPVFCLLLALLLSWMRERRQAIYYAAIAVVMLLALAGWPLTQLWLNDHRTTYWKESVPKNVVDHATMARELASRQNTGKKLVVIEEDNHVLPQEFYLFYGGINSHLTNLTLDQLGQMSPSPMAGICTADDFNLVQKQFPTARVDRALRDLIVWKLD